MKYLEERLASKKGKIGVKHLDCIKLWIEHFQNLLGQLCVIDDQPARKVFDSLPIETNDFTEEEVNKALKSLKSNKATTQYPS